MTTTAKVGVFAVITTALVALAFYGKQTLTDWANKISVRFQSIGKPLLKSGKLAVPVTLTLQNLTPISIPVDNVKIKLYKAGVQFGETENTGALSINTGNNAITLYPLIDLKKILPTGNILSQINSVLSNQSPVLDFVAAITTTIQGYSFTVEHPEKFYLTDLLNAKGLGLVPTGKRDVTPVPAHLKKLVPRPDGKNEVVKSFGTDPLRDTVPLIKKLVKRQLWQGKKLAAALKGNSIEQTVKNNWDFFNRHIQYKQDANGSEQVRSLRRVVHCGFGDCDDYVCSLSNLLTNQGIKHKLRVASYNGSTSPSHIYIKVLANGKYLTLDPVVHQFNYEVPYTTKHDYAA